MLANDARERYLNPYTDFGFKRLFGEEVNKELLLSFLNALFQGKQHITDIRYLKNENLGALENDRKAIFDVYCENDRGEKFIVEMQKAHQKFFKDRSVFYSTFPIQQQAKQGGWDFELKAVYTIGILNFVFDEDKDDPDYFHHEVKLVDVEKQKVFYDKLTFIYLEMPKFNKREDQLETLFEKWLYVLKYLPRLMDRPLALQERVFERVFQIAEIGKFNYDERMAYEESLKVFRDLNNVIDYAGEKGMIKGLEQGRAEGRAEGLAEGMAQGLEKGRAEGLEQGLEKGRAEGLAQGLEKGLLQGKEEGILMEKWENARRMKVMELPIETIAAITGLSKEEIETL